MSLYSLTIQNGRHFKTILVILSINELDRDFAPGKLHAMFC